VLSTEENPMDDLLRDFVVETTENIDVVDNELVRFEQDPNNKGIIAQIFRLVHTIKGTCGFLGLPRLEALTHAAETMIDRFRDGAPVTRDAVTLILSTIDRIKLIIAELDRSMAEPQGEDLDLISALEALTIAEQPASNLDAAVKGVQPATDITVGTLVYQVLERELRPGEVSLDELEKAFRDATADESEFGYGMLERAGLLTEDIQTASSAADINPAEDHVIENAVDSAMRNSTIRVPIDTLEHLMTMVSELVLTRNQLLELARRDEGSAFKLPLQRLSQVTAELQESVMKTRMQPIGNAWAKLPRLIRDLCQDLGKDIELTMSGSETEIDRQLLELIKDPMLHMIRNAADHGIERAGERMKAGKSPKGSIRVAAAQEGGYITLSIADDGRGLDLARIREKAVRQGLVSDADAARLNDQQIAKFIFHAGFSTAEKLTNISGRGVGMDVVRTNIEQMGGAIEVKTSLGQGTTVLIKIPLTLAIAAALIIESSGQRFALPQMAVVELVRPNGSTEARIEHIHSAPVLRLRERLLPLVQLSGVLGIKGEMTRDWSDAFIVVCQVGAMMFGIVVDGVLQTEEIVVKPVSARIRHLSCYSGATILGDGAVIMILDPNGLASHVGAIAAADNDNSSALSDLSGLGEQKSTFLIFKAGHDGPKAVPLAIVTRLEEIDVSRIEYASGRPMVQYRGRLMSLVSLTADAAIRTTGTQPVLVFGSGGSAVGLMVDEIIDIVEEHLAIDAMGTQPGIIGSAIIREKATDIVDVAYFVPDLGGGTSGKVKQQRRLLLVEKSDFLRGMLSPVLQAAGFQIQSVAAMADAERMIQHGSYDVVVAGVEDGAALTLAGLAPPATRFIGLASRAAPELLERAHRSGFDDVVGTFDREGLMLSLGNLTQAVGEAA
jgi:two-component system, chemotaxis family, sensor kinase CheA